MLLPRPKLIRPKKTPVFNPNQASLLDPSKREFLSFLLETARVLIECGCSSNRIEHLTMLLGETYGYEVETLALPTGVTISVRRGDDHMIDLIRVRSWSVDLDRLARLSAVIDQIHERQISISEGRRQLKVEAAKPHPYPLWLTLLSGGMASSILDFLYKGLPVEIILAFPGGILVQLVQRSFSLNESRRYLADFVSAGTVALYAKTAAHFFPEIDLPRLIVASIIVIIPGLVVVNAVHEIAQKNLVSGTAKLLDAFVVTAALSCGVIFVVGIWITAHKHLSMMF